MRLSGLLEGELLRVSYLFQSFLQNTSRYIKIQHFDWEPHLDRCSKQTSLSKYVQIKIRLMLGLLLRLGSQPKFHVFKWTVQINVQCASEPSYVASPASIAGTTPACSASMHVIRTLDSSSLQLECNSTSGQGQYSPKPTRHCDTRPLPQKKDETMMEKMDAQYFQKKRGSQIQIYKKKHPQNYRYFTWKKSQPKAPPVVPFARSPRAPCGSAPSCHSASAGAAAVPRRPPHAPRGRSRLGDIAPWTSATFWEKNMVDKLIWYIKYIIYVIYVNMSWYISLIFFDLCFNFPLSVDIAAEIRQRWSAKTKTSTSSVPCDPSHVVLPLWENPPTKTTTWNFCRRASKALVDKESPLHSGYHLFKCVQVCFLPSTPSGLLESLHWEASGFIAVVETLFGSAMRNAVATGFFQTRDPRQTKHPQLSQAEH